MALSENSSLSQFVLCLLGSWYWFSDRQRTDRSTYEVIARCTCHPHLEELDEITIAQAKRGDFLHERHGLWFLCESRQIFYSRRLTKAKLLVQLNEP